MATKAAKKDEAAEAATELRKILKPGNRVYTVLRHVSSSGMTRLIDVYAVKRNRLVYLTGYVAKALGLRRHPSKQGMSVSGCGMDMGFHVVYELSRVLFPKGFVPAKAGRTSGRNGSDPNDLDLDGGYALSHSWI